MKEKLRKIKNPSTRTAKQNIIFMFIGLMTVMLLSSLDQTIFSTALPTIVGELNGVDHMLWITTAYILASTIMLPVYGKMGDLIGRKGLLLGAVSIFMLGSIVGGLAGSMTWLIVGRAIQGLGGGGLMILSQATIADVIPARERGKYMGIMGGVFALSSVAGPLLGGWFTEGIGWRWAFWMNIPLGLLALASVIIFLHVPKIINEHKPKLDVLGMALLAMASTAIVLITTWGGATYEWNSAVIIGLIITGIVASVGFVLVERRAAEPIMPLHLFRKKNFVLTTSAGLIIGIAMFGALAYIPTYLQMSTGVGATKAGLMMIPMMTGLLVSSVVSGKLVTKTGRYKLFPVAGTALVVVALLLLSTLTPSLPVWVLCSYLAVLGIGLGLGMQVLVLIVQNTFPLREVGTATAGNNYFRQIGASIGAAVVGSLFTSRLTNILGERLHGGTAGNNINSFTPDLVQSMPPEMRDVIISSYNDALAPVFLYLVPLVMVAVILLIFVKEVPLRTSVERDALPESLEIDGSNAILLEK